MTIINIFLKINNSTVVVESHGSWVELYTNFGITNLDIKSGADAKGLDCLAHSLTLHATLILILCKIHIPLVYPSSCLDPTWPGIKYFDIL